MAGLVLSEPANPVRSIAFGFLVGSSLNEDSRSACLEPVIDFSPAFSGVYEAQRTENRPPGLRTSRSPFFPLKKSITGSRPQYPHLLSLEGNDEVLPDHVGGVE